MLDTDGFFAPAEIRLADPYDFDFERCWKHENINERMKSTSFFISVGQGNSRSAFKVYLLLAEKSDYYETQRQQNYDQTTLPA